ncbi:polysaccharide pyruvyl transferase family protein [Chryseobacterium sp. MFBS3-17]|uniref:polysaccharide pyruvyl transferase family protein n=1 Tax=Chryseobacterium sp. MFBS3-17 TaxID=2886689 RepID=UPI001D0E0041|nr:polysaccharide pyruvyl transferase family protein [Chryseobacterium sp. MFBS3-17]MCC2589431.1 polysaccharide pyruvyl transferase family protein [Chryseobacterium sp. MFBS3-17]
MDKNVQKKINGRILIKKLKNLPKEIFSSNVKILSSSVSPVFHNWGDDASIVIAELINPKAKFLQENYTFNIFKRPNYLCVGSIITWLTKPDSIIWGAGVQRPEDEILYNGEIILPRKIHAVRGPLTRQYFLDRNIDCPEIYGDPALLFPRYYKPQIEKKYKIGIIPHFKDKSSAILKDLEKRDDILIIDIQNFKTWNYFIDSINSCEFIFSSSLHGIIISDAYGIPNSWVEFDRKDLKRFTFHDYYLSVGKEIIEPYSFTDLELLEKAEELKTTWKSPKIDLDKLLSVCPFTEAKQP